MLAAWLAGVLACAAVVAHTRFTNDLSAFLPRSPSPAQRLLVEQLRNGVASRLVLIGIEGADATALAATSRRLGAALRGEPAFASVENGEFAALSRDRDLIWRYRYLLSPRLDAARFTAPGLRDSLQTQFERLASPVGMLASRTLPADPTGEALAILDRLGEQAGPALRDGVWFAPAGRRALLVARTAAEGSDTDGQARAVALIDAAFERAQPPHGARLLVSGPGVFSVMARETIKRDAWRLSLVATVLVVAMLLTLYRSLAMVALGLLPVASGALAGVAAVSTAFGSVHGVTLAFGVTLIGEGVDYAIYLFTQKPAGATSRAGFARIWPTVRLGMLTSVCGFAAMLFSGFTGLAQLGLFSIAGLLVAAAVTRWLLPELTPAGFDVGAAAVIGSRARALARLAPRLRVPALALVVLAAGWLLLKRERVWNSDLASLSPVPVRAQRLDQQLREDLGAPDVARLIVVRASSEEAALRASERVGGALHRAMQHGWLDGFDSPARVLPSRETQLARQAMLPAPQVLEHNLALAAKGLPFRPGVFAPFAKDIAAARAMAPLDRAQLGTSTLALKLDSLLVHADDGEWTAMLPLRGVSDAEAIVREVAALGDRRIAVLDLKGESERLYRSYLKEALRYSLAGAAAIVVLLSLALRSTRRVLDVLAPLVAAVLGTAALLALAGPLSLFHLVGLLLVVAVGSNYSLFFDSLSGEPDERARTLASLLFAAGSTVVGFGVLGFSSVPVLHALGTTVAIGAVLALALASIFSRHAQAL